MAKETAHISIWKKLQDKFDKEPNKSGLINKLLEQYYSAKEGKDEK